jgi:hypothetical protein
MGKAAERYNKAMHATCETHARDGRRYASKHLCHLSIAG